ncbi:MAG: hypothetical protein KME16_10975 [Scytolyngbya sp. HA4215-MV1]|nr:hypothetical protein [Scytolyngbya sp. HA4215-MV1]
MPRPPPTIYPSIQTGRDLRAEKGWIKPTHATRAWHTLREASYGRERVDKTKNHLPNAAPLRRINTN